MSLVTKRKRLIKDIWKNKWLYVILAPVLVYFFVFKYLPMYGVIVAFQDYNVFKGPFESPFVGLDVFRDVFSNKNFLRAVKNTLILNLLVLFFNFQFTLILALLINEIKKIAFKRMTQSILYLPHFLSWVVVAGIATNLFNVHSGSVNNILTSAGLSRIPFFSNTKWWTVTYVLLHMWKDAGWGTIIYLAALTGIDEALYDAAYVDGATKFQRLIYITLPSIKSILVINLTLQISRLMSIGLDAPLLLGNDMVISVSDVISTYVYRIGIVRAGYSEATAVGLFQSLVNIVILLLANRFAKSIGEEGIV